MALTENIKKICDEFICLYSPQEFFAVAQFYENFRQIEEEEVIKILRYDRH